MRATASEVFRMNRERFLRGDIAAAFSTEVWAEAKAAAGAANASVTASASSRLSNGFAQ